VSGSGKSTLVNDILAAQAARKLNGAKTLPGKHRHIENLDFFEKLVQVDQEPIGRSPARTRRATSTSCRCCATSMPRCRWRRFAGTSRAVSPSMCAAAAASAARATA